MSTDHPDRPADVQAADAPPVARIIPESAHPIREQQLDREALKVLYRLRDAGFKGSAFFAILDPFVVQAHVV